MRVPRPYMTQKRGTGSGDGGFTLVEMVIALFIVSIIMAIALPNFQAAGVHAAATGCEGNQRMLRAALAEYYLTYHTYPHEATTAADIADLKQAGFLDTTPTCPSGGTYEITVSGDGTTATVSCSVHGSLGDQ